MSSNWIEISEQNDLPSWITFGNVDKNLLYHKFGLTIGISDSRTSRAIFSQRQFFGVSINGSAAGKDKFLDIILLAELKMVIDNIIESVALNLSLQSYFERILNINIQL